MITLTKENYLEEINSPGPVVVMFSKIAGCSQCEHMKPVMEQFEKANPSIKVCVFPFEGKSKTEIPEAFAFRSFPGIFSFVNGQFIRAYSGVKTPQQLSMLLTTPVDIKAELYDLPRKITFLEKELEEYNKDAMLTMPIGLPTPKLEDLKPAQHGKKSK